jgi:hypothetical protein
MEVPGKVLTISKLEGARRQVEEAIKALERGDFDIAITLAGAAEGMLETTDLSAAVRKEARRDAGTPDPALAGRRQMTRRDRPRLMIPSRRVAVALPSVVPPPLVLVLPGIGGGGAGGERHRFAGMC